MKMFREHEQIVLTADILGDEGEELRAGDVGAIVHIHPKRQTFVVEFMALDGHTVAIATVLPSQVRPVSSGDIVHTRTMEITVE